MSAAVKPESTDRVSTSPDISHRADRTVILVWSSGQGCNSLIGGKARERPTAHDPVKV
jgi:hypothetical protein